MFCPDCLAEMKRYPVKPGTKVQIPARPEIPERKRSRSRKERSPEEQIAALHKLVQMLVILVAALATTLAVTVGLLIYTLMSDSAPQQPQTPMTRNYTTAAPLDGD